MAAVTRRQYKGAAASTTTTNSLTSADTSVTLSAITGWPSTASVPFYVVIDPGTSSEEKCSATISGSTLTLTRGQDDTTAVAHSSGATIYPVFSADDADEANNMASTMTTKGDLLVTTGSVFNRLAVGTNTYALLADSTATNGVAWGQIANGGLASDAVTTAKIQDLAVTGAKQANPTVSTKTVSYTLVAADRNTRVAMNSASATTITVNTSVFSAGDSVWIQNIGAGVCTITAGTATVTTSGSLALAANAGGTLYFTSASAAIFFGSGAANDWAAWTPTWANLTVGNATQTARYVQSGKTVFFSLKLVLGSTSSVGTAPTFTWPVTAASTASAQASVVQVVYLDANMAPYLGASDPRVRTTTVCGITAPTGTVQLQEQDRVVSSAGPFTWVSTDTIWVSGMFEAA